MEKKLEVFKLGDKETFCPDCGYKKFKPYVLISTGEIISPNLGRCNREYNCTHGQDDRAVVWEYLKGEKIDIDELKNRTPEPPKPLYLYPSDVWERFKKNALNDNLTRFIESRFGDCGDVFRLYEVGNTGQEIFIGQRKPEDQNGNETKDAPVENYECRFADRVAFAYRDINDRLRGVKVMKYNPDGHRAKRQTPDGKGRGIVGWLHHYDLKTQKIRIDKTRNEFRECFFGENLIKRTDLYKYVGIVESEKTALIGRICIPDVLFVAVGGRSKINQYEKLANLGLIQTPVIFYPDAEKDDEKEARNTQRKTNNISGDWSENLNKWHAGGLAKNWHVSKVALNELNDGEDIADKLLIDPNFAERLKMELETIFGTERPDQNAPSERPEPTTTESEKTTVTTPKIDIMENGNKIFTNTSTQTQSLIIDDQKYIYIVENVGKADPTRSTETPQFGDVSELLNMARGTGAKSVIYAPDYDIRTDTDTRPQFANIDGRFIFPDTPEAKRDKRGLMFADKYLSWIKTDGKQDDTPIYISFPCRGDFGAQSNGELMKLCNRAEIVGNSDQFKRDLLTWIFETVPKYISESLVVSQTLQSIFLNFPTDQRRETTRQIKQDSAKETPTLQKAGLSADYLDELNRHGKDGTKEAKKQRYANELIKAVNDNDDTEFKKVVGKLQSLDYYDEIQDAIKQNRTKYKDWEKLIQTPDDIETDIRLYRETDDDFPPEYDRNLSFSNRGVSVIVAQTKHGKTLFMLDTAIKYATKHPDETVFYFSDEEDGSQIVTKIYRHFADGHETAIRHGNDPKKPVNHDILQGLRRMIWENDPDLDDIRFDGEKVQNLHVVRVKDDINKTVAMINAVVMDERENYHRPVKACFLDYLQLFRDEGNSYSRTDELSHVCTALNNLSKDLQVGIITSAQFNREVKKSDVNFDSWGIAFIGESQSIENIATDVYLLVNATKIKKILKNSIEVNQTTDKLKAEDYKKISIRAERINEFTTPDNANFLYLENLISREHRGENYAVIPVNLQFGRVETGNQPTPKQTPNERKRNTANTNTDSDGNDGLVL